MRSHPSAWLQFQRRTLDTETIRISPCHSPLGPHHSEEGEFMSGRLKVLVVDDEMIVRESLVAWFKKEGYDVEGADGGQAAIDMVDQKDYDFIFLDIKMPNVDGFEVLDNVKQNSPHSMVVMITAYGSIETAVDAMKRGACDYLTKPFEPGDLA